MTQVALPFNGKIVTPSTLRIMRQRRKEQDYVVIDAVEAQRWLDEYKYPKQRPLIRSYVRDLADAMRRGAFDAEEQLQIAVLGDQWFLVDGQNRLAAVVECGIAFEFSVQWTIAQTMYEVDVLYSRLDQGKGRTANQRISALVSRPEDMPASEFQHVAPAVNFIMGSYRGDSKQQTDLAGPMVELYLPTAQQYFDVIAGASSSLAQRLRRRSSMALGLLTMRYVGVGDTPEDKKNRARMIEFWKGVALDDGVPAKDARKAAHNRIRDFNDSNSAACALNFRYLVEYFNRWMTRPDGTVGRVKPIGPSDSFKIECTDIEHKSGPQQKAA